MFLKALPFAASFLLLPLFIVAATWGDWWILGVPIYGFILVSLLDRAFGLNEENADPTTEDPALFWHRLVIWLWVPIQAAIILSGFIAVFMSDHLSTGESIALFAAMSVATGGVGINYAHELIHQRNRWEQRLGRILLSSVLYGHFATEHVHVHHRNVGTPADPVTARYNENFYHFFLRVLYGCLMSSWYFEKERLARKGRPVWHHRNPFWEYAGGALAFLAIAAAFGGWWGILLYVMQSGLAVLQLELVNYVEHYGLTRKYLGDGKYEHVRPRHSWNSAHRMTNYLLINLQRHSDHHYRPDRRFPLLQNYSTDEAPQLPYGYPMMTAMALQPWLWRRRMNPRVRKWRAMYYPEIVNWAPYVKGAHSG